MQYTITAPTKLNANISLPSSKSSSNRALIIYALSGGHMMPQNLSDCDDTEVIIDAIRHMPEVINIKAGGTAMRFMTAYLSVMRGTHIITGTGCKLTGGTLEIAGNVSSQYISALLMIGPVLEEGLELRLTGDIISRPYIDLTLWMMREFGADAEWSSGDTISVKPQPYKDRSYLIENDWSGASYWYEVVALSKDRDATVQLSGLMDGSKQGDSVVKYIFSLLGVKTIFETKEAGRLQMVTLKKSGRRVPRLEYDFVNSPDLAQTFVVTCCMMGVPFHFRGLSTLKIKETDRIEALKKELRKLGFVLTSIDDCELKWDGTRCDVEPGVSIDTYEDHRMALAFAPACSDGPIVINHPEVVTKSYPHYWDDLTDAGFTIEVKSEK